MKKQTFKKNQQSAIWLMLPLILVLGFIPLIVRLEIISLPEAIQPFWKESYAADFFSYYKSILLMLTAVYMLIALSAYYKDRTLRAMLQDKSLFVYFAAAGVFIVFTVLSTMFAQYKSVALFGAPERREGLFVLLIYLVILLYTIWVYLKKPDFRYILLPLGFITAIAGILGIFQFFGQDLVNTSFGQILVIPETYRQQGELNMLFPKGKIYGTMYHYNYMGSFSAMIFPLFLVLTLFLKEKKQKLFCACFMAISLFLLLGSTSRAGIIGVMLAAVCFVIFFAKKLKEHAKLAAGSIVILMILVIVINTVTGGLALARIPSLLSDMKAIVSASDIDYHDQIAIRDIELEEKKTTFIFHDYSSLVIEKNDSGQPVLTHSNGEKTTIKAKEGTIVIGEQKLAVLYANIDGVDIPFLALYVDGRMQMILGLFDDEFSFVNERIQRIQYEEAPSIGFEGKERLGSARGYIWSRSLPIMLEHLFIGSGPDTFFTEFPQGDYLANLYAYDGEITLVDKPHNLYLQIGIQQGGIALVAFLIFIGAYLVTSFRLYALRSSYNVQETIGAAITLSIIGYLGAGIFNDSIVSVAPIFWVLLGVGIAVNLINSRTNSQKTANKK